MQEQQLCIPAETARAMAAAMKGVVTKRLSALVCAVFVWVFLGVSFLNLSRSICRSARLPFCLPVCSVLSAWIFFVFCLSVCESVCLLVGCLCLSLSF